ncbi:cytosol aminopeptidase-like isoform X1 [Anopheles maculipalpis]|uniref:cytosol aminopeptidase-like isoform X1 n=1 Tax=Anopheles maculipalpis TaxID=1496333 RepID=UPI0021596938|nr:cytosol aminopeptidase-like isoform X1 [Anopheles maculipalpis]
MAFLVRSSICSLRFSRSYASMSKKQGLVLGVYSSDGKDEVKFTPYAQKYNESTAGKLLEQINICGPVKAGQTRIFWELGKFPAVAVAGLGDASKWDELDEIDGAKENVRIAAAAGVRALSANKIGEIAVEDMEGHAQQAAEGATLANYKFQVFKSKDKQTPLPTVGFAEDASGKADWERGVIIAEAQNFARVLMETPANHMTPSIFADTVKQRLSAANVEVLVHDEAWAREKKMGSFLSVTNGSNEPARFLELTYRGSSDEKCVALVGKGITFDSGGISLKPSANMDQMRADMGGAANVVSTILALAQLKAPVHVKGFVPLCENMPSGTATKPGDVVYAMNGKSICVDNTDAEGRLILADALCYASTFNPKFILDIATLTGAIKVALGDCVSGVFSSNKKLWETIHEAGSQTGDRVWRMPLFKHYSDQMCDHNGYDLNNLGKGKGGGSCTAAAFLREFVPKDTPWLHVDIAGVMGDCSDQSYTGSKGMSGRPMRTLVEFVTKAGSA